jgi:hypothetical protein
MRPKRGPLDGPPSRFPWREVTFLAPRLDPLRWKSRTLSTYTDFIRLFCDFAQRWPWWIGQGRELRTETAFGEECDPLTAMCATVTGYLVDVGSYRVAARALGLDDETARAIAAASDLVGGYNAHVRADLIRACRLSEHWGLEGRWNDPAFTASPYPHQYDQPFHRGSGWGGSASAARIPAHSRSTVESPSVALPSPPRVYIAATAVVVSISYGSCAILPASSSAFSVGISQPGCELVLELPRAV